MAQLGTPELLLKAVPPARTSLSGKVAGTRNSQSESAALDPGPRHQPPRTPSTVEDSSMSKLRVAWPAGGPPGQKQLWSKRSAGGCGKAAAAWQWSPTTIFTREDARSSPALVALRARRRILGVETGRLPATPPSGKTARSTGRRSEELEQQFPDLDLVLGYEAAATNSWRQLQPELWHLCIYVIDVSRLETKIPRRASPGITRLRPCW